MHQYLEMPVKGKCDGKGPRASTLQPPPAPAPALAPVPKRAPWMRRARPVLHGNSLPHRSRTPSPAALENPSAAVCWMWLSSLTHANAHGIAAWPHGSNYREWLIKQRRISWRLNLTSRPCCSVPIMREKGGHEPAMSTTSCSIKPVIGCLRRDSAVDNLASAKYANRRCSKVLTSACTSALSQD